MRFRPSREEFHAHAATHSVVPVWTELLADLETPVAAYTKLVGDGPGFLLESVEGAERWARFSFVGRNPSATLVLRGGRVELEGPLPEGIPTDRGILAAMEALLAQYTSPTFDDLPPLHGGMMGFLGYDVIREVEHLPDVPTDDRDYPDAVMSVIGSLAAFDHWRQRVYLIESVRTLGMPPAELDAAYDAAVVRVEQAVSDLAQPLAYTPVEPPTPDDDLPMLESTMGNGVYQRAVEVAKEHVVAGDIFQVVLAQRYDLELGADPFDVYRVLRQVNPSPYMYFVKHPELTIVGSSPEPMVQLLDRKVISRPIAGTRRRGRTDEHDRRMAAELIEHPKERAEHVMLVDLARNDVGRVAKFGTVTVDELMTLERYSHVMHLTSQVSGDLVDDLGPIDVLRANAAGRDGQRRAEGAGDGDHRLARTGQARAVCRRCRVRRLVGQPRHGDRDPHDVHHRRRQDGQPPGRCRDRRRLGPRRRGPRVSQQGGRAARRHSGGPADDFGPERRRDVGLEDEDQEEDRRHDREREPAHDRQRHQARQPRQRPQRQSQLRKAGSMLIHALAHRGELA